MAALAFFLSCAGLPVVSASGTVEPSTAVVAVFSCLAGASVEIDGKSAGTAVQGEWAGFTVPSGTRRLRVSDPRGDFKDFEVTVSPLEGQTVEIVHVPEAVVPESDASATPGVFFFRLKGGKP